MDRPRRGRGDGETVRMNRIATEETIQPALWTRIDQSGLPLLLARLIVGVTFIWMGISKAADPVTFLKLIRQYEMLPESPPYFLNGTAVILPWVEILCGLALVLGIAVRGAALMAALMLCVFTPAIFLRALTIRQETGMSFFAIAFDCGCGGGETIIWKKLLENLALLGLSVVALVSRSRKFCLQPLIERRRPKPSF